MATDQPGVPTPLTGAYTMLEPQTGALIREILERRDPDLSSRLAGHDAVSRNDVEEVEKVLYHEFVQHLGEDWEPSTYGKAVDNAIGAFVTRFLIEREADEA